MNVQDFLVLSRQDLQHPTVFSSLTLDYQLQHTNSWSQRGEASWMGKEKLAEWIISQSCGPEHPVREQSSQLPGDHCCKWALQLSYRTYPFSELGPRVILRIRKQLQLKKDGGCILTFMSYLLSNATLQRTQYCMVPKLSLLILCW